MEGARLLDPTPTTRTPATFDAWLRQVTPTYNWDWPYLVEIRRHLDLITTGQLKRLAIFMPPRHGKSALATIRYPVYRISRDPGTRVIVGCYNSLLAEKFSRQALRLARAHGVPLDPKRHAVYDWETVQGGGMRAVGVGAGVTGQGCAILQIDDPVKSREEANSPTYRERVWDWYKEDLYTRLEPGGAITLIMTRWHEDDLAGRILASDAGRDWTVLSLPAEAEAGDPLGRAEGEPLCPDRFDKAALADIRHVMGDWAYAALYQQTPLPQGGTFFDTSQLAIVDALPAGLKFCRGWDLAATPGGDRTAGIKVGGPDATGLWYVADATVIDATADVARRTLRQTAELDGTAVRIRLPQDPGQAGKDQAQQLTRLLAGFTTIVLPVSGEKAVRAGGFAAQINAGNVRLLRGAWNAALISEFASFPLGAHDDQVDAAADAFNWLAGASNFLTALRSQQEPKP